MVSRHVGKGDSWKKEGEGEARISSGVSRGSIREERTYEEGEGRVH